MSIELAEQLKRELTDKYVVVRTGVPELRRFVKLTGQVKTVNMNGKALVQFNSPEDIGWYDIDPSYLKVVEKPQPKGKGEEQHEPKAAKPAAKAAPAAGMSPLEMARAQGAGTAAPAAGKALSPLELARQQGAGGAKPAAPAGDKPLSPLELARQQGAGGNKPAPAGDKPLSPLELARQQGAMGSQPKPAAPKVPPPAAKTPEPAPAPEPAAKAPAPVSKPSAPQGGPQSLSTEEILALARQQGAFTG